MSVYYNKQSLFLSTPSARRATLSILGAERSNEISIHALREEGDAALCTVRDELEISIHALREEGDKHERRHQTVMLNFYPRPPRGGRPTSSSCRTGSCGFLSTPSARRAT